MSKPHNLCTARKGKDGKTYWTRIGTGWPDDKGGFNITFEALPIPTYSQEYGLRVEAKLFPPKDEAADQGGQYGDDRDMPF
jgi:hypothetical protein